MKRDMADQSTGQTGHADFEIVVNDVTKKFPHIVSLREEYVDCLENLVVGRDVFATPQWFS